MKYEENCRIELKRELVDDLDKEIIAFLNAHGGTIYIGVDDDGKVVGVPQALKDEYDEKVSSILSNNIKPNPRSKIEFSFNGENVLVIDIKEGDSKPYYLTNKGPKPSGTYIRVGRSKRPATDNEILTMIRDSSGWLWENQTSKEQGLTFDEISKIAKNKGLDFGVHKFRNLKIVNKNGEFTNLGLLVSDQNPIEVKFAVYDKNLDFKVKQEFHGSIATIASDVLKYAELFNATSAKIIPGQISRVESKSYPGASLREAILNAICHAEYFAPSNIKIEFFPDKVKITNPGNIYNDGTIDDIKNGIQSFRNPSLVLLLNKLGYIENYGTGIQRILEAYQGKELQPEFYVSKSYFMVTLHSLNPIEPNVNPIEPNVNPKGSMETAINFDDKILNLISNGKKTNKELMKETNLSKTTIFRITQRLKASGKIYKVGSNRLGWWEIIPKKED